MADSHKAPRGGASTNIICWGPFAVFAIAFHVATKYDMNKDVDDDDDSDDTM